MPFQNWSKRTKIIVATVTTVSVLALALGLGLGLGLRKKDNALPDAVDGNQLLSAKCPNFNALGPNGKQVTVEGIYRKAMQVGTLETSKYQFVLEYGTGSSMELLTILVDMSTGKWLQANVASGAVIRTTGVKTDCSIRVAYDSKNDPSKPTTNTDINVVTSTTRIVQPTTTNGGNTVTNKPTTTVNPPKPTTNVQSTTTNNVQTTTNNVQTTTNNVQTTTTTVNPPPTPTPGVLKIAVVLFGFSNDPAPAETGETFLNNLMYGNGPNGMIQVFDKNFYGKIKFQGLKNPDKPADVFGWTTINRRNDDNCNYDDWTAEARQYFGLSEFSGYDHIIHVASNAPRCNFGGLATVPGWWSLNINTWKTDTKAIIYHEIGHNLGFDHAGSCSNLRGSKVSVTDASLASCNFAEYGDMMDLMGVPPRDENTEYKGWRFETNRRNHYKAALPAANALKLTSANSGAYSLTDAEDYDLSGNKIKSICYPMKKQRIVNGYTFDNYCLELTSSENIKFHGAYKTGVIVRMTQNTWHARSMLMQVILGVPTDYFEDADNGFKVTLVSVTPSVASIKLDLK